MSEEDEAMSAKEAAEMLIAMERRAGDLIQALMDANVPPDEVTMGGLLLLYRRLCLEYKMTKEDSLKLYEAAWRGAEVVNMARMVKSRQTDTKH